MNEAVLLIIVLAVAIVAAYFYVRRRKQHGAFSGSEGSAPRTEREP